MKINVVTNTIVSNVTEGIPHSNSATGLSKEHSQHKMQPSPVIPPTPTDLPTPIKVKPFAAFLQTGYHDSEFIIKGFTEGFHLHHEGPITPLWSTNSHSTTKNLDKELEKINNERDPVSYTHLTLPTNREV